MVLPNSRHSIVLSAVLVAQILGMMSITRQEKPAAHQPLSELPAAFSDWRMAQEGVVEKYVLASLRADDVLSRTYVDSTGRNTASLFVAYFRSQRTGVVPHSPKHCLPGAGWVPLAAQTASLNVPGRAGPIKVNSYQISKGEAVSIVLYWYESHGRVIASEYAAKFYLIVDSIRHNRTDVALVRVLVPAVQGRLAEAEQVAQRFASAVFPVLRPHVPR